MGGDLRIAEEALPMILGSGSLTSKITDELKHHHKWFGIIFYYSKSFPRVLRVISLATNVLIMLFIQSLTYALTNPDDGTCERMTTQEDCLAPQSPYATGESKCYWDSNHIGSECALVQPDSAMMVILFVAVFSALISTPLAMLVDWIVLQVLASPLKVPAVVPRSGHSPRRSLVLGDNMTSVVAGSAGTPRAAVSGIARKRGGNFRLSSLFGVDNPSAQVAENSAKLHAQTDLRLLISKITTYRSNLTDTERAEFDAVWGLDDTGHFKTDAENASKIWGLDYMVRMSGSSAGTETGSVAQRVLQDLGTVYTTLQAEQLNCTETQMTVKEKGKRLMYLFQCDLLPGVSGKILEAKSNRDNLRTQHVSWEAKFAGWLFVTCLNLGMISYVMLFALNQTTHRQGAWALSFLLWLVVEILMVSSLTVLFTHVLVPSLIMKDVNKIKSKLIDSIRTFNTNMKNADKKKALDYEGGTSAEEEDQSFSSTDFLFVSSRLAKQWSDLRESKIIAQFKTPWPKQSYQRESDVSGMYSKKFSALSRSASILAIFFLSNLLQVPPSLQDTLVHMVTTSAIGYTVVLHIDLYKIFPALVILPLALMAVVVHFILQSKSADAKSQLSKLLESGAGEKPLARAGKLAEIVPYVADDDGAASFHAKRARDEALNAKGALNTPVEPINKHISRRASAVQGMKVLGALHRKPPAHGVSIRVDQSGSSEHSCSDESDASSGDDVEEINREEQAMTASLQRERAAHARATLLANAARTSAAGAAVWDVEDLQDLPQDEPINISDGDPTTLQVPIVPVLNATVRKTSAGCVDLPQYNTDCISAGAEDTTKNTSVNQQAPVAGANSDLESLHDLSEVDLVSVGASVPRQEAQGSNTLVLERTAIPAQDATAHKASAQVADSDGDSLQELSEEDLASVGATVPRPVQARDTNSLHALPAQTLDAPIQNATAHKAPAPVVDSDGESLLDLSDEDVISIGTGAPAPVAQTRAAQVPPLPVPDTVVRRAEALAAPTREASKRSVGEYDGSIEDDKDSSEDSEDDVSLSDDDVSLSDESL